jgi:hypothetical protein
MFEIVEVGVSRLPGTSKSKISIEASASRHGAEPADGMR